MADCTDCSICRGYYFHYSFPDECQRSDLQCDPKLVLRSAVSVGIGLFIAFLGLQNANIVVGGSTLVQLFSVDAYNQANGVEASFNNVGITVLLAIIGVLITAITGD